MRDKDVIKTQTTIIKLQEQVIYELLHDFIDATDGELKYIVNKINICADLKYGL